MKRFRFWYTWNPIQVKYIILVLASMFLPLGTAWICVQFLYKWFVIGIASLPPDQFDQAIKALDIVKYIWAIGIICSFFILMASTLYISHRLIGPISRLEKGLDRVLEGDTSVDLQVREKDDLKNLADRIVKLVLKLRAR